jgi:predicted AAA+ superfamily ATPase
MKLEIERTIYKSIKEQCFQGKVIILLGARQVGKTTLLKQLIGELKTNAVWLNADESDVKEAFENSGTSTQLLQLIGAETKLAILDEAQQIKGIGKKLKLIYDSQPHIQIIATGSSAFDLQNETNEPLTGRKREFYLFPMSFSELASHTSVLEEKRLLETRLVFGSYPEVIKNAGQEKEALLEIANSYLFKDILQFDGIRKSTVLRKLLQALALQMGSEVSFNELSRIIGNISSETVERYLDLLEKAYVIYQLPALSRNMRNELKKGKKYYFYDTGIRNVLINNFSQINLRTDKGALWENYLISERMKYLNYTRQTVNRHFWRTKDQAEIDYIEETEGVLKAFELKWADQKVRFPNSFLTHYPNHETQLISVQNYMEFIS